MQGDHSLGTHLSRFESLSDKSVEGGIEFKAGVNTNRV